MGAALLIWLLRTPVAPMREQLKSLQFWSLELCVALAITLAIVLLRPLVRGFDTRDAMRMVLLASVALLMTLAVAPRTNRIYYDEQIYQSVGQNLADLHLAQMCTEGTVEYGRLQCFVGEYNKQPYAFPHLLSLAYRVFGVHGSTAFVVNSIVMALTVCAVYVLVVLLFDDRVAALCAALLLALTPQQIIWSATAAVEPSASLACVAAVLCAALFRRSGGTAALIAASVFAAYAVQFRPESFLIVPVVGLLVSERRDEFKRPRLWWAALVGFALLAVHIGHMLAVRHEGWGTTDARLSFKYLANNLRVNGWFYLADWRFPAAFTLLAALGLGVPVSRNGRLAVGVWFLMFFGIFLLFYAGSYDYGADVRYSLLTYPPLAVLGGVGAARLARWLAALGPGNRATAAVVGAIGFQFLWYAPLVRATTEEAWAARADVRFASSLVHELQGNTYVLTHNPGMFHVWGVNAGQVSRIVIDQGYLAALSARYSGGVYLHWNFWCNVQDPVQQEFCQQALVAGRFEPVRELRERGQRFALYRLAAPADAK